MKTHPGNLAALAALIFTCTAQAAVLYEADAGTNQVREYTAPDTYSVFADVTYPTGLAVYGGSLFVATLTGEILQFTAPNTYTVFASGLSPKGIDCDPLGNLFVVNSPSTEPAQILKFTGANTYTVFGTGPLTFSGIAAVGPNDVYVTDCTFSGAVWHFTAPNSGSIIASGAFTYPTGILYNGTLRVASQPAYAYAVDSSGNLYEADWTNGHGASGVILKNGAPYATGLTIPTDIVVSAQAIVPEPASAALLLAGGALLGLGPRRQARCGGAEDSRDC